jgi:hypothetical protein
MDETTHGLGRQNGKTTDDRRQLKEAPATISCKPGLKQNSTHDRLHYERCFPGARRVYTIILGLHNVVRWLVILAGLWAVGRAWRGWLARGTWTTMDGRAARFFVGALDLQFVLGILLYAIFSPLTRRAFRNIGMAMHDAPVRYFLVEHVTIMLAAILVAHIGLVRVKHETTDAARFQTAALWLGIALAAIIGFVPWFRPLVPSR